MRSTPPKWWMSYQLGQLGLRQVMLVQPSLAAVERVFSLLENSFSQRQLKCWGLYFTVCKATMQLQINCLFRMKVTFLNWNRLTFENSKNRQKFFFVNASRPHSVRYTVDHTLCMYIDHTLWSIHTISLGAQTPPLFDRQVGGFTHASPRTSQWLR